MRAFRRAPVLWLVAVLAVAPAFASGPAPATTELVAAPAPLTASPGSPDRILRVAARCPTFSWSAQPAAAGYELVVYRLPEEESSETVAAAPEPAAAEGAEPAEEPALALRAEVPAGVSSWTPSLDRCFESGQRYAWLVRAWADGEPGRWSEARLFEVDAVVVRSELEEVLRGVLARYFSAGAAPGDGASSDSPRTLAASASRPSSGPSAELTGSSQLHLPVGQAVTYSELPAGATDPGSSAILGESLASAGPTYGVRGITTSAQTPGPSSGDPANRSAGVRGEASAGAAYGVLGITTSSNLGQQADRARGVFGKAVAAGGVAIEGQSSSLSTTPDVEDSLGTGVRGVSVFAGGRGVEGVATGPNSGLTPATGVYGKSTSGRGVWGAAGSGVGVFGASVSGVGVRAQGVTADVEVVGSGKVRATNTLELESVGDSVVLLPNDSLRLDAGGIEVVGTGSDIVISGTGDLEVVGGGNITVSSPGKFIGDGSLLDGVSITDLACQPARCVDTTDIAVGAVGSTEISDESILSADIKNGEVSSVDIKDGQVFSLDLAEDSFNLKQRDSAQAGVTNVLTLTHLLEDPENGSAGIGTGLLFRAEDSAGNPDSMGRIAAVFTDASDGSEGGELQFFARSAIALVKVMTVDEAGVDLGAKTLDTTGAVTAGSFAGDGSLVTGVDAATSDDLNCVGCVSEAELGFDPATQVELDAQVHDGADITTGTVAEPRIASAIARDSEVTSDIAAHTGLPDAHREHASLEESAEIDADITAHTGLPDAHREHATLEESAEIDADITAHAGLPDAHREHASLEESAEIVAAIAAQAALDELKYVDVAGDVMTGDLDVSGTLRTISDNATSLRLRGVCDANSPAGDDSVFDATCQSYAGVFYNSGYPSLGGGAGEGARTTRAILGSNEDMDLVLQGSNHIQIVAVDDNVGIGKVIIQAEDEIEFHAFDPPYGPGGGNAESRNLIATMDSDGLRLLPRANAPATPCTQGRLYADVSGALCFCAVASWENLASGGTCT